MFFLTQGKFTRNSRQIANLNRKQIKTLQEGLGSIRDIILDASHEVFIDIYKKADMKIRYRQAQSRFLSQFPRYFLEAIGLVLKAGLALSLRNLSDSPLDVLPILGTMTLGAQRLLPVMQQTFNGWTGIYASYAAVLNVLKILDISPSQLVSYNKNIKPYIFKDEIGLNEISFKYSKNGRDI